MAHMYPDPISPDTASNAESKLYKLLKEQLDDTFTVMHSVAWLARDPQDGASDGEADFVIAHPDYGVMVLEVKGGQVRLNSKSGQWYSIDRHGRQHAIKDPFGQTTRSMYALKKKLAEAPPTRHYSWFVSRAVAFPDVAVSGDLRPDAPRELILDQIGRASCRERGEVRLPPRPSPNNGWSSGATASPALQIP